MFKRIIMEEEHIIEEVLSLQGEAYKVEAELIDFDDLPPLKDNIRSLKDSGEIFYGYYEGNELSGLISYKIQGDVLDIHRIAVKPKYFRQGIAKKLIHHMEKINPSIQKIIVATGLKNEPAVRLYKKIGFQEVGKVEVEKGLVIVKFQKFLNDPLF